MNEHQKTVLEEALRYEAMGLSVIPLKPKSKEPAIKWQKYQSERATPEEIRAWVSSHPDLNIGIVTGPISGVAVVDLDHGADPSIYPTTGSVKTGSGNWHLYYSIPAGMHVPNKVRVRENTDSRGEGGYVAAPPSVHPAEPNNSYEWVEAFDSVSDLPPFPLHMFQDTTRDKSTSDWRSIPGNAVSEGGRNNEATRYIGGVLRALPQEVWDMAGWGALKELNRTFSPPLDEKELRSVYESIAETEATRRIGGDTQRAERKNEGALVLSPFTWASLHNEALPPLRWLVDKLIPLGGISLVTGDPGGFKSYLVQSLTGSIVLGEPFLGKFPTLSGKVLIIDEENQKTLIQDRLNSIGVPPMDDIVFLHHEGIKMDNPSHVEVVRQLVEEMQPRVIIIDTLICIHNGDENSSRDMSSLFQAIRDITSEDRTVIVLHHNKKPQGFGGDDETYSARGSTDILAKVEARLAVRKKGDDVLIKQEKLRMGRAIKPFKAGLRPTEDGRTLFTYLGEDTSKEEALEEVKNKIADVLFKASEEEPHRPETRATLSDALNMPQAKIATALLPMLEDGTVVRGPNAERGLHQYFLTVAYSGPIHEDSQKILDRIAKEKAEQGEKSGGKIQPRIQLDNDEPVL